MESRTTYEREHESRYGEGRYGESQGRHSEGPVARAIEQHTAKLPSDTFLWAALGSMGASLALGIAGRDKASTFVGQWVPTLLVFGLYNKLVKLHGSDGAH